MKAYKIEILVNDLDNLGEELIREEITNARYPNDCIVPQIMSIESREVGDWTDDHPLNKLDTIVEEYNKLFSKKS
jgi:hypothetical protein